jgi:hypothetical protein
MKFTLRQAHKLLEKIAARMGTLKLSANQAVSIWTEIPAEEIMAKLLKEYTEQVTRQFDLLNCRQEIRSSIQAINAAEVNGLISIRKGLLDQVATLRHLQGTITASSINTPLALAKKLEAERASSAAGSRYGNESVGVCVLDEAAAAALDRKISSMQLRIEGIEDQLSVANATASIVVTADAMMVLRREGVVL